MGTVPVLGRMVSTPNAGMTKAREQEVVFSVTTFNNKGTPALAYKVAGKYPLFSADKIKSPSATSWNFKHYRGQKRCNVCIRNFCVDKINILAFSLCFPCRKLRCGRSRLCGCTGSQKYGDYKYYNHDTTKKICLHG